MSDSDDVQNTPYLRETKGTHKFKYDVLHELGHLICGHGCCREHCEYEAHGAAKALAFILGIDIGDANERMDLSYAGRTPRKACPAIQLQKESRSAKKHFKLSDKKEGTK